MSGGNGKQREETMTETCACGSGPPVKISDGRIRCMNCGLDVTPDSLGLPDSVASRAMWGDPAVLRAIGSRRKCYVEREAGRTCPECGEPLEFYRHGLGPQFVCESCRIVTAGEGGPDISW